MYITCKAQNICPSMDSWDVSLMDYEFNKSLTTVLSKYSPWNSGIMQTHGRPLNVRVHGLTGWNFYIKEQQIESEMVGKWLQAFIKVKPQTWKKQNIVWPKNWIPPTMIPAHDVQAVLNLDINHFLQSLGPSINVHSQKWLDHKFLFCGALSLMEFFL